MAEPTNFERAERIEPLVFAYMKETGTEFETVTEDMLTDIMHWVAFQVYIGADKATFDFKRALRLAEMHYEAENGGFE